VSRKKKSKIATLPPKVVKTKVIKAGGAGGDGEGLAPFARHGSLSHVRTLPVLAAFQDFLNTERKRSRRRLLALWAVFVVLFVLLAGSAFVGGLLFYSRMSSDMLDVREDVAALEQRALDVKQRTEASLNGFAEETQTFRGEFERRTQAFSLEKAGLTDAVARTDKEMKSLRDALVRLEVENKILRADLERAGKALSAGIEDVRRTVAGQRAQSDEPTTDDEPERVADLNLPSALTVFIQPEGADRAVPWRLPIP